MSVRTLVFAFMALVLSVAQAVAEPSHQNWRTSESQHFRIHYPNELSTLAFQAIRICEEAHDALVPLFHYAPTVRTEVTLTDRTDSANGSATAIPFNHVRIYAAVPELGGSLGDYDDWLRQLIYHEYAHILELDQIQGPYKWLNAILGKTFAPNHITPSFLLEGTTVYLESQVSGRGRLRSALYRSILRAQALAGKLHSLDAVVHLPQDYPGATVWYLYGGHFINWLVNQYGTDSFANIFEKISHMLIPYGLQRTFKEVVGQDLEHLYDEWQRELTLVSEQEREAILRSGVSQLKTITTSGNQHQNPRFLQDGSLVVLERSEDRPAGLYRYQRTVQGYDKGTLLYSNPHIDSFDVCSDRLLLSIRTNQFGSITADFNDLYTFEPSSNRLTRLTKNKRLREPSCHRLGEKALASEMSMGRTRLVQVSLLDGSVEVVFDPIEQQSDDGSVSSHALDQIAMPLYDQAQGAVFIWNGIGGRRLVHLQQLSDVRSVYDLVETDSLKLYPALSQNKLFFTSDQSGLFEIYSINWPPQGESPVVRARDVIGVLDAQLSTDETTLAMRVETADGDDIVYMTFDESTLKPLEPLHNPAPVHRSLNPVSLNDYPSERYREWVGLIPRSYVPNIESSTEHHTIGLEVSATDPAELHSVSASVALHPGEWGGESALTYTCLRYWPQLGLSLSHVSSTYRDVAYYDSGLHNQRLHLTNGRLYVSLPFAGALDRGSVSLSYGHTWQRLAKNKPPTFDPMDRSPIFPGEHHMGDLTLSLMLYSQEAFVHSVSVNKGWSLSTTFRLRRPELGGTYHSSEVFLDASGYLPIWRRSLLAIQLKHSFGIDRSGTIRYGLQSAPSRNLIWDALNNTQMGNRYLRGFPDYTVQGAQITLATLEYRLPLVDIFHGLSTLPFFLSRVKLSAFLDMAQASEDPLSAPSITDSFKSVGLEIVVQSIVAWRRELNARLGLAHGLGGETQIYMNFGQWF